MQSIIKSNPEAKLPEVLWLWVQREFNTKQREVFDGLLDVATGTTQGNKFEQDVVAMLAQAWEARHDS